jgi:hypothetical protein
MNYRPRPVFQEYFAYTAGLIEANRAFFASADAPDWLIFSPGSIDGRYPNSADGALWTEFLLRYEPTSLSRDLLFLQRRPRSLAGSNTSIYHVEARLGEPISIQTGRPVFTKIRMQSTWIGRMLRLLYRSPTVTMIIKTKANAEFEYRLIPEMAASGFLLSPRINSVRSYLALALGNMDAIEFEEIQNFEISLRGLGKWAFSDKVEVELIAMDTEELRRAGEANELRGKTEDQATLVRAMMNSGIKPSSAIQITNDGLFAHPPSRLPLDVPQGAQRLTIGFGIRDGAWQEGRTDGVCFRIGDSDHASNGNMLFERCLRPVTDTNDRGNQTATIDVTASGGKRLWFETTCLINCSWDWSYWSRIKFD